jgi:hypothetical protein
VPLGKLARICLLATPAAAILPGAIDRPVLAAEFKWLPWEMIETTCPVMGDTWTNCRFTERLEVAGGSLVRSTHLMREQSTLFLPPGHPGAGAGQTYKTVGGLGTGVGLTFLPDPRYTWAP